ncbi:hypothetical protein [Aliiroseovarius subalbicans]|uniref:hypothetical protein n=1 Tax=Aliiroseovarius subalbicans TaxID=2925840 RepID=UPI001F58DC05|nr:hypothetical protein [Aliiroseovarius subalbicans]
MFTLAGKSQQEPTCGLFPALTRAKAVDWFFVPQSTVDQTDNNTAVSTRCIFRLSIAPVPDIKAVTFFVVSALGAM